MRGTGLFFAYFIYNVIVFTTAVNINQQINPTISATSVKKVYMTD